MPQEPLMVLELADNQDTGGGGGAGKCFYHSSNKAGKSGGSGIVVVRYKIGSNICKSNWWFISFYGGKTIHAFTSSGTLITPRMLQYQMQSSLSSAGAVVAVVDWLKVVAVVLVVYSTLIRWSHHP